MLLLILTHRSLFLLPHCKKNSVSGGLIIILVPSSFFSSFSICVSSLTAKTLRSERSEQMNPQKPQSCKSLQSEEPPNQKEKEKEILLAQFRYNPRYQNQNLFLFFFLSREDCSNALVMCEVREFLKRESLLRLFKKEQLV